MVSINSFIREYSKAIREGNVAVFAGAGLSKPAGFVNWKELLREIAEDIGLDVDKETDLVAVAQYHVNEKGGNRGKINQVLIDEFMKDTILTENHHLLARLPISTYWTSNYDKLIEDALRIARKRPDVKITKENLGHSVAGASAIVYKMHGDVTLPHEAVLTKDDYEGYNLKRQLFTTSLQGDLVSNTFLFLGFSFDDPNLNQILSRIRVLLGENQRTHYCIMKRVAECEFSSKEEFIYAQTKQNLKINDLRRYSIEAVLVSQYQDITKILKELEAIHRRQNIFISGSAAEYGPWGEERALKFASKLSQSIIKNGNSIVTGFGVGLGSCIISGALEELYTSGEKNVAERLQARPFPQQSTGMLSIKELWTNYRQDMLDGVGISIFIFGNKLDMNRNIVEANGMVEEYQISRDKKSIPIPIGATGYTAQKIWREVMDNFDQFIQDQGLRGHYEKIGDLASEEEEIIQSVLAIINTLVRGRFVI